MLSKSNLIRILANTLLGGLLVFFWVKLVNINEVLDSLKNANLLFIIPFILTFILSNLLRSLRLKLMLSQFKIPLPNIIYLTYLAQLLSFTIPLRVGEVTKAVYLSTKYPIVISKSIIWIFLDRFLDFWLILFLAGVLLTVIPNNLPVSLTQTIFLITSIVTFVIIITMIFPDKIRSLAMLFKKLLILKILQKIFSHISNFFIDNIAFLYKPNTSQPPKKGLVRVGTLLLLTLLALISDGIGWFSLFLAVFGANLSFLKIMLGSLLSSLTFLIPAAPGYVGSAEASSLVVFNFGLGLDKTLVSATAVLNHGITLGCILVFGLIGLYLLKFDLKLVWKKFKK